MRGVGLGFLLFSGLSIEEIFVFTPLIAFMVFGRSVIWSIFMCLGRRICLLEKLIVKMLNCLSKKPPICRMLVVSVTGFTVDGEARL